VLPHKNVAKAALGLSADDFVVLFFGQCKRVKRLDLLVEGIAHARHEGASRLKLVIAGAMADVEGEALMAQIHRELGEAAVHCARFIPNEELPTFFAAADLAVLPYDQIYQSGVVLLAMTYEVPVLSSDIKGMLEIVRHADTGVNFRAGDVAALSARLIEIERGDWPILDYARRARSHVLSKHSWGSVGQITAEIYREQILFKRRVN
jgi:D-inositol-3-phosphate glycosyltransferase